MFATPSRRCGGGHFEGKLHCSNRIGMPLAPKGNQDLR